MPDFLQGIFDLLLHRYVRDGDSVCIYNSGVQTNCGVATVEGWGRYAAVRIDNGNLVIRRDGIVKDEDGRWFYQLEGA